MGSVYLLGDSNKEGIYKIGVTNGSVEKRIKKLQTGNSGEIYIVSIYNSEYPFFIEARLHQRFYGKHISGEWYELSDEEVQKFKEYCEIAERIIISLKDNPFFKIK